MRGIWISLHIDKLNPQQCDEIVWVDSVTHVVGFSIGSPNHPTFYLLGKFVTYSRYPRVEGMYMLGKAIRKKLSFFGVI